MPHSQSLIHVFKKLEAKKYMMKKKKRRRRNRNKTGNKIRQSKDRLYNLR